MAVTDQRPITNGERGGGWRTYVDWGVVGWEGGAGYDHDHQPSTARSAFQTAATPFFSCSLPREDVKIFIDFFFKKKGENPDYKRKVWWIYILPFSWIENCICFSTLSVDPVRFHGGFQFQRARNESHKSLFTYLA